MSTRSDVRVTIIKYAGTASTANRKILGSLDNFWFFRSIRIFYEICGSVVGIRKKEAKRHSCCFLVLKHCRVLNDFGLFNPSAGYSFYYGLYSKHNDLCSKLDAYSRKEKSRRCGFGRVI